MEAKRVSKLLLVDDEAEIREIVAMNLNSLNVEMLEAGDGEAALEVLRAQPIDLVISDLMMPRMTGLTLLATMRDNGFLQPFIFLTAYPSQETTVQALRLGAFDYLEKPFVGHELRALVSEALRVSHEMSRLGLSQTKDGSKPPLSAVPTQKIQKLRTLRGDEAAPVSASPAKKGPKSEPLTEFFIGEATAQLLFCQSSILKLGDHDERVVELSYLFRVMQSIADAAKSIGAQDISELARAAEYFYTALRIRPHLMTPDLEQLASWSNKALQAAISAVSEHGTSGQDLRSHVTALHQACALLANAS